MDESDQIRDTYAHFGLAVYMAQVLEHGLVNAMLVASLAGGKRLSHADIDAFMDKKFELTLGRLIRDLRAHITVEDSLAQLLGAALEKRNWLAHGYFRERAEVFMSEAGRASMIAELQATRVCFKAADERLDQVVRPLSDRIGLTQEKIEAEMRRVLDQARGGT
jgi:hypothetical protein